MAAAYKDLTEYIDFSGCEGLNTKPPGGLRCLFDDDDAYLETDVDPEMLLTVRFLQPMKIFSLRIWSGNNTAAYPRDIKLFCNRSNLDFSDAHNASAAEIAQSLTLKQTSGPDFADEVKLRFVKFQNVSSLTVFVSSNFGAESTVIRRLQFIGQPKEIMDMNKFEKKG